MNIFSALYCEFDIYSSLIVEQSYEINSRTEL